MLLHKNTKLFFSKFNKLHKVLIFKSVNLIMILEYYIVQL